VPGNSEHVSGYSEHWGPDTSDSEKFTDGEQSTIGTIVSSEQQKIQIFLKITLLTILESFFKRNYSIAIKHVHDY
jgi:hypothetical protein